MNSLDVINESGTYLLFVWYGCQVRKETLCFVVVKTLKSYSCRSPEATAECLVDAPTIALHGVLRYQFNTYFVVHSQICANGWFLCSFVSSQEENNAELQGWL